MIAFTPCPNCTCPQCNPPLGYVWSWPEYQSDSATTTNCFNSHQSTAVTINPPTNWAPPFEPPKETLKQLRARLSREAVRLWALALRQGEPPRPPQDSQRERKRRRVGRAVGMSEAWRVTQP